MSYQALARKWRPKTFDEVIGQEHVVSALINGLDNQRVHHAFLFTGTRGVGKTTLARIFARALNCEQGIKSTPCGECTACRGVDNGNFIDLIEVDAASRTRVDDTRELLDNVQYTPAQGRFKIYLIDEVHMLSTHSFNALLKTLEEPPEHVKFLLATTDPQKLPTTILSRCIQFNLKAMDIARLNKQLEKILDAEGIKYDGAALLILARSANGSVRDALSLLDQGIAFGNGEVRTEKIRAMLGMIDDAFTRQLLAQICAGQSDAALQTITEMATRSVDFSAAMDEVLTTLHNIALHQINPQAVEWKGIDSTDLAPLAQETDAELLQLLYQIAVLGKRDLALAPDPRTGFEMTVLRMIAFNPDTVSASAKPKSATVSSAAAKSSPSPQSSPTPSPKKETSSAEAASAAEEVAPSSPSAPSSEKLTFTAEQLCEGENWAVCIAQSNLRGVARELMMNMIPRTVTDGKLQLTVDADHEHLLSAGRLEKIETELNAQLSLSLKLKVTAGKVAAGDGETPSQQQARTRTEQHQAAAQVFQNDPNVQEIVDGFDGEIAADSIRPPA